MARKWSEEDMKERFDVRLLTNQDPGKASDEVFLEDGPNLNDGEQEPDHEGEGCYAEKNEQQVTHGDLDDQVQDCKTHTSLVLQNQGGAAQRSKKPALPARPRIHRPQHWVNPYHACSCCKRTMCNHFKKCATCQHWAGKHGDQDACYQLARQVSDDALVPVCI